jgi:hypothetical protein
MCSTTLKDYSITAPRLVRHVRNVNSELCFLRWPAQQLEQERENRTEQHRDRARRSSSGTHVFHAVLEDHVRLLVWLGVGVVVHLGIGTHEDDVRLSRKHSSSTTVVSL